MKLLWPKPKSRPYDLANVFPAARPDGSTKPVNELGDGANKPRWSRGRGPGNKRYYWCLSCNTVVAHWNQPLCARHKEARKKFMREASDARARARKEERRAQAARAREPVLVPRQTLTRIHDLHQEVVSRTESMEAVRRAREPMTPAWVALRKAIGELDTYLRDHLPPK